MVFTTPGFSALPHRITVNITVHVGSSFTKEVAYATFRSRAWAM
jgi:hypothetical protein